MVDFGQYCLLAAFLFCVYGLVAGIVGVVKRDPAWIRSAENSVVAHFGLILAALIALWQLIFTNQFQVDFVSRTSSTTIPLFYKVTALWGGQSGSLLFWTGILSALAMVAVLQNRHRNRTLMPYTNLVLLGTLCFFTLLTKFVANPFLLRPDFPSEGVGLNPLLQNYWMAIHPPILYIGLISVTLPFAFAMGALLSGKLDTSWIPTTRRWALFSFSFLGLGFTLGGVWAYEELGWGGYWAWDPVENASFMPWLALTAFLHSVMVTEKKGMLKTWNFMLILLAFELT
ncbi:MAG: cytochrome c biogenesis protein CcsA, partial [Acidobacteriota bacterium]